MKNRFALCAFLTFVFAWNAVLAQPNGKPVKAKELEYGTAAVFYPFAALFDNFKLGVEHRPSDEIGIRGIFLYGYGEDNFFYDNIDTYSSFGGEFQFRYYAVPTNPALFAGLYAGGRSITATRFEYEITQPPTYPLVQVEKEYNAAQFTFGVMGGFQALVVRRFLFDMYLGMGPNIPSGDYKIPDENYDPGFNFNNDNFGYIAPGMRKGMKIRLGFNGGVVLFK